MSIAIATVTLLCGALILYHHVVYPAILRHVHRAWREQSTQEGDS